MLRRRSRARPGRLPVFDRTELSARARMLRTGAPRRQITSAGRLRPRPRPAETAAMDFNDTPEEAAWRAEFRAWLETHAPQVIGAPPEHDMEIGGGDYLERAKRWQA